LEKAKQARIHQLGFVSSLAQALETWLAEVPARIEEVAQIRSGKEDENYEQFILSVKKLYPNFDSVKISNLYIKFRAHQLSATPHPFGQALLQEVEGDSLLTDVILANRAILDY
jgi:hypothetical protein